MDLKDVFSKLGGWAVAVLTVSLLAIFLSLKFPNFKVNVSSVALGVEAGGGVRQLSDDTFEHDTQAASGATTGDWLIKFYIPECSKCLSVAPIFENVAASMAQKVIFGAVDVQNNTRTSSRFNISHVPTFIMFSKGKMYLFSGEPTVQSLKSFASGDFKKNKVAADIPTEVTLLGQYLLLFKQLCNSAWGLSYRFPEATILVFLVGIFVGMILTLVMCAFCCKKGGGSSTASRRSKARKTD